MTDIKDLPKIKGIYIFHFDNGIGKDFTRALCVGVREHTNKPIFYEFAYRNEFNPAYSIIVSSLKEGNFILSEGNVIHLKGKSGSPSWTDTVNYDSRVDKDRAKYSSLDMMLSEVKL